MATPLRPTRVAIVGAADRQLEDMFRSAGLQVSSGPLEVLGTLAQARSPQPDAILLDLRDRAAVPQALGTLRRHHPQTGVVIVASQLDPALMLEAMRAGVTDWLTEPISPSAVIAAVQRVIARHEGASGLGQVFAFVGAKGGVGTTTLATNVAVALRTLSRQSCLLVDLHLHDGDAALFLGAEPRFSVVDAIENIHRLDPALLKSLVVHTKTGADLLASAERTTGLVPTVEQVRTLVEFVVQHYAYVVLDVPRSDATTLDALELASKVIVVANQELPTVRNASRLTVALRQRYGKSRVDVVVCRYDRNAEIGREDLERASGGAIRHVIPSDYRVALDALNKGRPVVVENHSRLATSMTGLARTLAGLEPGTPAGEKPARLFGRLGARRS